MSEIEDTIERFEKTKKQVKKWERKVSENRGKQKQILKQLKEQYGCENIQEAKKLLRELDRELMELQEEITSKTEKLQQAWEQLEQEE